MARLIHHTIVRQRCYQLVGALKKGDVTRVTIRLRQLSRHLHDGSLEDCKTIAKMLIQATKDQ